MLLYILLKLSNLARERLQVILIAIILLLDLWLATVGMRQLPARTGLEETDPVWMASAGQPWTWIWKKT